LKQKEFSLLLYSSAYYMVRGFEQQSNKLRHFVRILVHASTDRYTRFAGAAVTNGYDKTTYRSRKVNTFFPSDWLTCCVEILLD